MKNIVLVTKRIEILIVYIFESDRISQETNKIKKGTLKKEDIQPDMLRELKENGKSLKDILSGLNKKISSRIISLLDTYSKSSSTNPKIMYSNLNTLF
jgi:hypothetical protein